MKDFLGKELNVGDHIVFARKHYRELSRGVIGRFTAKYVVINLENGDEFKQTPKQVVKIVE